MSVSVDGFIAGPNDVPGNPGGDGFMRLHDWYQRADGSFGRPDGPAGAVWDEMHDTGAVFVGRRTAEQVDYYGGTHHGVPLFVLTRREPDPQFPQVHFVSDVAEGMAAAKAAAGERDVLVHGAEAARTALEAGVLDELQIDQVPVLLGAGRRLFDVLPERIELEIARVIDTPAATHVRYRVVR
ncbi:dihydrofolate reductase family protein [Kribbella yunnanensis]